MQIVCDHGSDLRKGIALFRQQAPSCVETYDISHAAATQLKAHWRDNAPWQDFPVTAPVIREAMASVRSIDVEQWVQTHLGPSMLARRRRALRPDMKTA